MPVLCWEMDEYPCNSVDRRDTSTFCNKAMGYDGALGKAVVVIRPPATTQSINGFVRTGLLGLSPP